MIVVYDGECRVCSALIRWLERRLGDRLVALPYQHPGVPARFGLNVAQAEAAVWSVEATGNRARGAAAINRVLGELGGPWAWLARLYGVPGLGGVEDAGYRWFSAHRHLFGRFFGPPTCTAGDPCQKEVAMTPRTLDPRGRTPLEEGLSLLPYARLNLRMHRRRLRWGVLATVAAGALWLLSRRRATPGP